MGRVTPAPGDTGERPLRRDAERNRQRIIAAAADVFAERGLAATLDDVAHRAGVGVGTVYRRFPDKEALLAATFHDRLETITALATKALEMADGWTGLSWFLHRCVEMQAADRGLRDVALAAGHGPDKLTAAREHIAPLAGRLVARAQAEGSLRPDVGETDLPVLIFMVTELAHHCQADRPDAPLRYLRLMLDGMRSGGPASPLPPALTHDELVAFGGSLSPFRGRQSG